ncbi:MAG: Glycosyl transferase, group 1 [uncultured bacterium (gcode 4)]|uniref:Glycosyl transferase, group 1 n=1 Tax=uncultured bacterium (gcode 4) TaxID=1234023 RepID=K2GWV7_9BACT|nr:MAG: Glycosyl transferase, group 1 [uncultured bacterium (gcode 4)]
MVKNKWKKVAIVADWIKDWWGAEKVLWDIMELYPDADIFTSVFYQFGNPLFDKRRVFVSFLQKIWFASKINKMIPFLRPYAFESLDLSWYDIIISSSSAESKWIITKPETIHICYCHTPTRYYWSHYFEYFDRLEFWILNPVARWVMPKFIHSLRMWDYCAAQRVDHFIANSKNTQSRIAKYYHRNSQVIYPAIDVSEFPFSAIKEDYYFYVWRCIPYKKFDLLVDAFNKNGKKLILATATNNKLYKSLKKRSLPNIEWKLNIPNSEVRKLMSTAKAVMFPPEEDFWIVPLEAMACWTPVISYAKWWSLETVRDKDPLMFSTWIFFEEQTVESVNKAIEEFEEREYDPLKMREYTYNYDISNFRKEFLEFVESKVQ